MLDIYICEDNARQREFVAGFVTDYCIFRNLDAGVALASGNPDEVLSHYKNILNPALFLLDIELGAALNGIELAGRIRELGKKAAIVFLTTHSEMTLLTFQYKVEALDFIIKDGTDNIKKKIAECINTAIERLTARARSKTLRVATEDKIIFVDMEDIIFIETTHIRHKLRLHTKRRVLEFNGELKTMGKQLEPDERFIRCHKSCIINKDKVISINKTDGTVTMSNNSACPISRSGKKLLSAPSKAASQPSRDSQ